MIGCRSVVLTLLCAVTATTASGAKQASSPTGNDRASASRETPALHVTRAGTQSSRIAATTFTGDGVLDTVFREDGGARPSGGRVTFQPAARTHWHSHALGQLLIIIAGHGYVQAFGQPAVEVGPGDVVWTPPGVKHWHGAAPREAMTHFAVSDRTNGENVNWLEPVTDEQYQTATKGKWPSGFISKERIAP